MSEIYGNRGIEIAGGAGAVAWDSTGKRYIDFMCGHGAALFGHAHPALVTALNEASGRPWTVGAGMRSPQREKFIEQLRDLVPDARVYLSNSGAESIEAALKLAVALRPGRKRILALRRAFHGRTLGALSLTFNPQYRKYWKDLLPEVTHISPENAAEEVDENTVAVFIEPVQGEGGVYPLSEETLKDIRNACNAKDVLIVADEIQSGWGRCGKVLASRVLGLEPDITCFAKGVAGGLPIGVTLWSRDLGDFPVKGHGSTYGGNPLVCSVASKAYDLLKSEKYPEKAARDGEAFRSAIKNMASPLVTEVRGVGLLTGIGLTVKANLVVNGLEEKGILSLNAGPMVLRFLPPFTALDEHYDQVLVSLKEILEGLEK
ncbi:MAG: aspartate aminotransferase family protein [Synergistales bacterium]|nr:aspartate aminotransferase family protein [Synergistales bacterium]